MINKPREFVIPPADPFANDKLGRKELAQNLLTLVLNAADPLVISVNGRFGTGKTTFLRMWIEATRAEGVVVHYISAWENDFQKHALSVLLAELAEILPSTKKATNKLRQIGVELLKSAIPSAVKLATIGLVDVGEAAKEALAQTASSFAESQISDHLRSKDSIKKYKSELSRVASHVAPVSKVVVVVDELDRCRPDFAIEYLEVVKHIFSVPNTVFVLGIDRQQIAESVRTIYGQKFDTDGYLRRFFDLQVELPVTTTEGFATDLADQFEFNKILESRSRYQELRTEAAGLSECILCLSRSFDLSLRDTERVYTLLSIVLRTFEPTQYLLPECLAFLSVVKIAFPTEYSDIVQRRWRLEELWPWLVSRIAIEKEFWSTNNSFGPQIISEFSRSIYEERLLPEVANFFKGREADIGLTKRHRDYAAQVGQLISVRRYSNRAGNEVEFLGKKLGFFDRIVM